MDEIQQLINNTTISLNKLETKIRETINTPISNINVDNYLLINIPDNYIRKASFFRESYNLTRLIHNKDEKDNIAYSLQLSDLHNYFINRFNIIFSVGSLFRKQAIINIVCIQEGILKCTYISLRNNCIDENKNLCKYSSSCIYYLKSLDKMRYNGLLEQYKETIGFYDEIIFEKLKEQKDIRDKIHIHLISENELINNSDYSKGKYNEAILVLHFIRDNLLTYIERFKKERMKVCKKYI